MKDMNINIQGPQGTSDRIYSMMHTMRNIVIRSFESQRQCETLQNTKKNLLATYKESSIRF